MSRDQDLLFDDGTDLELQVRRWVGAARRRWPLVFVGAIAGAIGGWAIFETLPSRYEAVATLQIERHSLVPGTDAEAFWSQPWWDVEYYPTRNRLLESRGLAERVVRSLDLENDPAFNADGPFLGDAAEDAERSEVVGRLAERLLEGLSIQPVPETRLVRVVHRSGSPELSARIANRMATEFIAWELETRESVGGKVSEYLAGQIELLREDIGHRESEVLARRTSEAESPVPLDQDEVQLLEHLRQLQRDYLKAQSASISSEQESRRLSDAPAEVLLARPRRSEIEPLERQLDALRERYRADLENFRPEWPAMQELRKRIDSAESTLAERREGEIDELRRELRREAADARARVTSLEEEIRRVRERIRDAGSVRLETSGLEIELETRRELFDQLLRLRAQTDLHSMLETSNDANVRVVSTALTPLRPFEPSLGRWLGRGLGVGLVLGLALAVLAEILDRRIQTAEEAEDLLGLPVLGVVPDVAVRPGQQYVYRRRLGRRLIGGRRVPATWELVKNKTRRERMEVELLPVEHPRHAVAEAYRTLGGTLLQILPELPRVVAVTSAQPGEGKTSTVANLGVVLAQLGRRVVVVDCDLRRPRLGSVFGKERGSAGLAEILLEGCPVEEALRSTAVPGLSVLPSGDLPEQPWQLLASPSFGRLLERLATGFEVVLLDTPPLLAVTDPSLIGPRVDGVVICLQAGRVTREELRACAERLQVGTSNLLGTILNRFVPTLGGGYGSYSYYYYESSEASAPRSETA